MHVCAKVCVCVHVCACVFAHANQQLLAFLLSSVVIACVRACVQARAREYIVTAAAVRRMRGASASRCVLDRRRVCVCLLYVCVFALGFKTQG